MRGEGMLCKCPAGAYAAAVGMETHSLAFNWAISCYE